MCEHWFDGRGEWLCVALLSTLIPFACWTLGYVMGMMEERRRGSRPSPLSPNPVCGDEEEGEAKPRRRRRRRAGQDEVD